MTKKITPPETATANTQRLPDDQVRLLERVAKANRKGRRSAISQVSKKGAKANGLATLAFAQLEVLYRATASLKPNPRNARLHLEKQVAQLVAIIREVGFTSPILIDEDLVIIAGHGRLLAAKQLGLETVPTIMVTGLTELQKRHLMLADNKIALNASWDLQMLSVELLELSNPELEIDVSLSAFGTAEIDFLTSQQDKAKRGRADKLDQVDAVDRSVPSVSQQGDLWVLGVHRLFVGDALNAASYDRLLGDEIAHQAITDPPYNVSINGLVGGLGKTRHAEFAMASGEMTSDEFREFLRTAIMHMIAHLKDGAILMMFMDWRHEEELRQAGRAAGLELKNLVVWDKTVGGMGSLYRSQHELVLVFKHGTAPHVNNVELGRHGRYRTNVWQYLGANTFRAGRAEDLKAHPTVKPIALIMDAIKDCSKLKDIILDPFGGSGTTMLAAERVGRRARLIELDSYYADTAVRRWQDLTGLDAINADTGESFGSRAAARLAA